MKHLSIFAIIVGMLMIVACSPADPIEKPKQLERKVFENKEAILKAIDDLEMESYTRNLTADEIRSLQPVLPKDHFIDDFYRESLWLAEHDGGEHIGHSLSFIYSYVRDGIPIICVPHEIDHLNLYIAYNDTEMINHAIREAEEGYDNWVTNSEAARKLLPAYYRDFDRTKDEVRLAIEKTKQKDYEGAMPHIEYVSEHQVC